MLRIFARLRHMALSNPGAHKYLLYASGELLLVVLGILIALQINNWNEERVAQNEIRAYALNLSAAIERDMEMLVPVATQIRASIRQANLRADYLRDRAVRDIDNAELFFLTTNTGYRPYAWSRAAMEQLKSAGGLRQMRNKVLAERISDYDALVQHLDQDYLEDEQWSRAMLDLSLRLVDRNYGDSFLDEAIRWEDSFTDADIEQRVTQFRTSEVFGKMAALKKPLLSDDLAAYRRLANLSVHYANNTSARPDIELPRLRQFAAEIQTMIDEEYR